MGNLYQESVEMCNTLTAFSEMLTREEVPDELVLQICREVQKHSSVTVSSILGDQSYCDIYKNIQHNVIVNNIDRVVYEFLNDLNGNKWIGNARL